MIMAMRIGIDILKWIVLVFITFFSCQVITNGKKRISYIGTLLICFSSAIIEYRDSGLMEAIMAGELIFLSFSRLLEDSHKQWLYVLAIPIRRIRILIAF